MIAFVIIKESITIPLECVIVPFSFRERGCVCVFSSHTFQLTRAGVIVIVILIDLHVIVIVIVILNFNSNSNSNRLH